MVKEYGKKSYKLLFLWFLCFILLAVAIIPIVKVFIPNLSATVSSKIIYLVTFAFLLLLFFVIQKTERTYFINGVTYEQSKAASSEMRVKFANAHLVRFAIAAAVFLIYCIVGFILVTPIMIDTIFFCLVLIIAAVSTVNIRL